MRLKKFKCWKKIRRWHCDLDTMDFDPAGTRKYVLREGWMRHQTREGCVKSLLKRIQSAWTTSGVLATRHWIPVISRWLPATSQPCKDREPMGVGRVEAEHWREHHTWSDVANTDQRSLLLGHQRGTTRRRRRRGWSFLSFVIDRRSKQIFYRILE